MDKQVVREINIVEPGLSNFTGHSASFVKSLVDPADLAGINTVVWYRKDGEITFNANDQRIFHPVLYKPHLFLFLRKWQASKERVLFLPTCDLTMMQTMALGFRNEVPADSVFCYVHWFRNKSSRLKRLAKVARKQPNLNIVVHNPGLMGIFQNAGFTNIHLVKYPYCFSTEKSPEPFRKLLFSGAARWNKGFPQVVDYVERLSGEGASIPVVLQASAPGSKGYDDLTAAALEKLDTLEYPKLTVYRETLTPTEYQDLYSGAVSLQLYDPDDFRYSVSGVALDCIENLCPIICTAGTWTAEIVTERKLGVVLEHRASLDQVHAAVEEIINSFETFQENLVACRSQFQEQYDPKRIIDTICGTVIEN